MSKLDTPQDVGFEVEIKTSGRAHDAGAAPRPAPAVPTISPVRAAAKAQARRRNLTLLIVGVVGFALVAVWAYFSNPNSNVPPEAVARVNGEYIYDQDITRYIDLEKALLEATSNTKGTAPSAADALENLISLKMQAQDARKAGVTLSPDEQDAALKGVLGEMKVNEAAMAQALGKYGLTLADLKTVTSDGYLISKYKNEVVLAGVTSDADKQKRTNDWQTNLAQTTKVDRLKPPGSGPAPTLGSEAPDFTVRDMAGNAVKLSSFRGRPVMINFWATWCSPCRVEIPEIVKMYNETHDKTHGAGQYEILGVATNSDVETIKAFSQEFGMTFPLLPDDGNHVTSLYHVLPIPTTFFIDKTGTIRETHIGPVDRATMEKWLLGR